MFDKLKQLKQFRDIQKNLEKERAEVEKDGVKVVVNGKMEIEDVQITSELPIEKQGEIIKNCVNEAMNKIKSAAAQKMMQQM